MPFPPPALIFLAFPLLELAGLIAAGRAFGVGPVLAWVIVSAALGLFLLRAAGWATLGGDAGVDAKGRGAVLRHAVRCGDDLRRDPADPARLHHRRPGFVAADRAAAPFRRRRVLP